jgi:hypothetical protein
LVKENYVCLGERTPRKLLIFLLRAGVRAQVTSFPIISSIREAMEWRLEECGIFICFTVTMVTRRDNNEYVTFMCSMVHIRLWGELSFKIILR